MSRQYVAKLSIPQEVTDLVHQRPALLLPRVISVHRHASTDFVAPDQDARQCRGQIHLEESKPGFQLQPRLNLQGGAVTIAKLLSEEGRCVRSDEPHLHA